MKRLFIIMIAGFTTIPSFSIENDPTHCSENTASIASRIIPQTMDVITHAEGPVTSIEYFNYKPGMKSFKLSFQPDPSQPLYLMDVAGTDYHYDKATNSIIFDRKSARLGTDKTPSKEMVASGQVIWVNYRKNGELDDLKKRFGNELSPATLQHLQNYSDNKKAGLRIHYTVSDGKAVVTQTDDVGHRDVKTFTGSEIPSVVNALHAMGADGTPELMPPQNCGLKSGATIADKNLEPDLYQAAPETKSGAKKGK